MKRLLVILYIIFFAEMIFAQQPVDYLIRAKAFIDRGNKQEAINLLTDAMAKTRDFRFYIARAEAYMSTSDYVNAASDCESANSIEINSGEFGLARIFALKGDAPNSLKHLERNLNSSFKKSEKVIMLDPAFSLIENTPVWRQFWKTERYNVFEAKIPEIEYYISTGNVNDASAVLDELKAGYREDPETRYAEALVSLAGQKYSESVTIVTKILETDAKNEKYLRLMARAQLLSGNPSGASRSYSNLINAGVPDAGLYLLRAEAYSRTGETEMALKDVLRYLELYPENRSALGEAGKLEARAGNNLKAIDYFTKNIKFNPGDPGCYTDRGDFYFVSRVWDSAVRDYSMSLDIQPVNSETWLNKGIALINLGNTDDACHDFREALSLGNKKAAGLINRHCIR